MDVNSACIETVARTKEFEGTIRYECCERGCKVHIDITGEKVLILKGEDVWNATHKDKVGKGIFEKMCDYIILWAIENEKVVAILLELKSGRIGRKEDIVEKFERGLDTLFEEIFGKVPDCKKECCKVFFVLAHGKKNADALRLLYNQKIKKHGITGRIYPIKCGESMNTFMQRVREKLLK